MNHYLIGAAWLDGGALSVAGVSISVGSPIDDSRDLEWVKTAVRPQIKSALDAAGAHDFAIISFSRYEMGGTPR